MSVSESKVVSLWEKAYKQNVQNKFLTKTEACQMIANQLGLDYKAINIILKNRHEFHLIQ